MRVGVREEKMDEKPFSHTFVIGRVDDGSWLAVSARAPYFCFKGDSSDMVTETANRALDFYFGNEGRVANIPSLKGKREKTLSTFRPTKRIGKECERV